MLAPRRKAYAGALFLLCAIIGAAMLIAGRSRPNGREMILLDGTRMEYLGSTFGTNHWNPSATQLDRWIDHWPRLSRRLISHLPTMARGSPSRAVAREPWGAFWFYTTDPLCQNRDLVVRCYDSAGDEVGSGYRLYFVSANAAPVVLHELTREDYERIRRIDIYKRNVVLDPIFFAIVSHEPDSFLVRIEVGEDRAE